MDKFALQKIYTNLKGDKLEGVFRSSVLSEPRINGKCRPGKSVIGFVDYALPHRIPTGPGIFIFESCIAADMTA